MPFFGHQNISSHVPNEVCGCPSYSVVGGVGARAEVMAAVSGVGWTSAGFWRAVSSLRLGIGIPVEATYEPKVKLAEKRSTISSKVI